MGLDSLFNYLPLVPERVQKAAEEAVKKAAFDIAAIAMASHPFQNDTGFAESSIYVEVHSGENKYPYSAIEPPSKPGAELLPEIDHPSSRTIAYVAWGANYGIYLEFGTAHMGAYPTLGPAAEIVKPELEKGVKAMMDKFVVF